MTFYPGQHVVCISDQYRRGSAVDCGEVINVPRKGVVYTVRGLFDGGRGIWLEEVRNPQERWASGFHEYAWHPTRFRPLSESRLDIFRQHLITPPRERADA